MNTETPDGGYREHNCIQMGRTNGFLILRGKNTHTLTHSHTHIHTHTHTHTHAHTHTNTHTHTHTHFSRKNVNILDEYVKNMC